MRKLHIKNDELIYTFTCEKDEWKTIYKLYENDTKIISVIDDGSGFDFICFKDITDYDGFSETFLFMYCVKLCDEQLMGTYEIFEATKIMDL